MKDEEHASLFSHVNADKARLYRSILSVFASARRQFRLSLRPDKILVEGACTFSGLASLVNGRSRAATDGARAYRYASIRR